MASRSNPKPPPTLGQLRHATAWLWVGCKKCQYEQPTALVPLVIRFGKNVSSDHLRISAVCPRCSSTGAKLRHPSWSMEDKGPGPLPTYYQNGQWSHAPLHARWPGTPGYGEPPDTTPPKPFLFDA
jgi:hypothetical protein